MDSVTMRRARSPRSPESSSEHRVVAMTNLLDLPEELLIEIFLSSANAAFPTTCKYLYEALCADPRGGDGPPMWMQRRFIENSNPTLQYALRKCLRCRFFSAETVRAYLPHIRNLSSVGLLYIPLRCVLKASHSTRELMLYTELFLHGIPLSDKNKNIALIHFAATQREVDPTSFFWQTTKNDKFDETYILHAFRLAARKRSFDREHGMFDFLFKRFGIDEHMGHELWVAAAKKKDAEFMATLHHYGFHPGMDDLRSMMA